MQVLHIVPSLDRADGGPSVSVPLVAQAIASQGIQIVVATTSVDAAVSETQRDGIRFLSFPRMTRQYKTSRQLAIWLKKHARDYDLIHLHALFSFSTTVAARIARNQNVPYIVRPLGVLNRWGLRNRRKLLKAISLQLIERRILSHAAAVHYTTGAERSEAVSIGEWIAKLRSFVIPLPVEIPELSRYNAENFFARFPQTRGRQIILFLSRIDRKKGIELLLSAFSLVRKQFHDVSLVIAGAGDQEYEGSLRVKARDLGIADDVVWTGFLAERPKTEALISASIFVLSSYSENFGVAAAEAFAAGRPCILSDQVGIAPAAKAASAALVTACDAGELSAAMTRLLADQEERRRLGEAARQFASERLSLDGVGRQLEQQYRGIVKRHGFREDSST